MKRFRRIAHYPDPYRAVKVQGNMTKNAALSMQTEIAKLMKISDEPITLYINSKGGSVHSLDIFEKLFCSTNSAGDPQQFITVADGPVRSTAAFLLVLGHYAYATSDKGIVFHGARYQTIETLKSIKKQDAMAMAMHLDVENRRIAGTMAAAISHRVALLFLNYWGKGASFKGHSTLTPATQLGNFVGYICGHLASDKCKSLIRRAHQSAMSFYETAHAIQSFEAMNANCSQAIIEAEIFRKLILETVQNRANEATSIDEATAPDLMFDYLFTRGLLLTKPHPVLSKLVSISGQYFLSERERATYKQLGGIKRKDADQFLCFTTGPRLACLWCYTMAICRQLLIKDIYISASDAYWLGLVDDVVACNLT